MINSVNTNAVGYNMAEQKMGFLREIKSAITAGKETGKSGGSFDAQI